MSVSSTETPADFESAVGELEAIVKGMEDGGLTLEQSLAAYERGTVLLRYCQTALSEAERKLQVLEAGQLAEFQPEESGGA